MKLANIRNFSIIAHIDHGKSTLADRLMEFTGAVTERESTAQLLDSMDLERERGITIKASSVRLNYKARDGQDYLLNLIDTPGHVDFAYEVSRSLAACEGALLVVDAAQGVEAQTLANVYLALDNNLDILPIINKIDLPSAEPERVRAEIEDVIGLDASAAVLASAKQGKGIDEALEGLVKHIRAPDGSADNPLKALIFDSWFDPYHGAVVVVRVFDGVITKGTRIRMMSSGSDFPVLQVGVFAPRPTPIDRLGPGEVGFFMAGIKEVAQTKIGDTVTDAERPAVTPLPGFKEVKPMVFSGLYPTESTQYEVLRDAVEKLRLNDSAFSYEAESSTALGFGFRCGFLGLLHMDIVRERLEREYDLSLICTAPTVAYRVTTTRKQQFMIDTPAKLPPLGEIEMIEEPIILASIHVPEAYLGGVMALCEDKRGRQRELRYLGPNRILLEYELPLNEVVLDFYDRLKSVSKGYASLDYEYLDLKQSDLVKLEVLVNGDPVDALSLIVHRERSFVRGREMLGKMREMIPRQMFEVVLQAAIGTKIISREVVKALRKNVTAKCYGGDISRKRKLLERQKEGKKRMKQVGQVEIPQEAFLAVLKVLPSAAVTHADETEAEAHDAPESQGYGRLVVIAIAIALGLRIFVIQAAKIPSSSMLPTLAAGDHVLINKLAYGLPSLWGRGWLLLWRQPKPGDVIVFINPVDHSQDYIKRVAAIGGEIVEIRDKRLLVNGHARDGVYAYFADGAEHVLATPPRDNYGPTVIPSNKFFVLGDNRDQSIDSRFWGVVDIDDIKGRADILYWSWDGRDRWVRWQPISHDIE